MSLSKKITSKYNIAVPRYTSYPTIPNWKELPSFEIWSKSLIENKSGVDLYIHIPFCKKLCWYCGCNRTISKNKEDSKKYALYLVKEWQRYLNTLNSIKVNSIHLGGGTPNFLEPEDLEYVLSILGGKDVDISIELDPRTLSNDFIKKLSLFNVKNLSFGIQDFDLDVQSAINRVQSYELVLDKLSYVKKTINPVINFDLIYGLPKQSISTMRDTIEKVALLRPDHIALYSYAHLPKVLKNQKLISESDLPEGLDKRALYEFAKNRLEEVGYVEIGFDHFALRNSPLHLAELKNKLKRNFMGYTVTKSPVIIGLGVSAISESELMYVQNTKDLKKYYESIDNDENLIEKGIVFTNEDIKNKKIIEQVMCNKIIRKNDCKDFLNNIEELLNESLIKEKEDSFVITNKGLPFIRNIAATFDTYLACNKTTFSKSL